MQKKGSGKLESVESWRVWGIGKTQTIDSAFRVHPARWKQVRGSALILLLLVIFFRGLIFKSHVYNAEQTDLVLPCSKTYRLDEKFVDTAKNQPLTVARVGSRLYRRIFWFCFQF